MNQWKEILEYCLDRELGKIILSNPRQKEGIRKVEIRPVLLKNELKFQAAAYTQKQVQHYNLSAEEVYENALNWTKEYDNELYEMLQDKEYSLRVFGIERGNKKPRKDIAKWSDVKNSIIYMYDNKFLDNDISYEYAKISDKEEVNKLLKSYIEEYFDINDDKDKWLVK